HDFASPVVACVASNINSCPLRSNAAPNSIPMEPQVTLRAMIRSVPLNEMANALGNRRVRAEIDLAHQIVDISVGRRNVAWLHREQLTLCFFADCFLKETYNFEKFYRLIIANVVDAPWRAA